MTPIKLIISNHFVFIETNCCLMEITMELQQRQQFQDYKACPPLLQLSRPLY